MEWYVDRVFKELPFGLGIAMAILLGILLMIWLLLPLWVLFIQWNTGKMRQEIRHLADLIEKKHREERKGSAAEPKD